MQIRNTTKHNRRFNRTLKFMLKCMPPPANVLDLGIENSFSKKMTEQGYNVRNTQGEDLDIEFEAINNYENVDVVTAFEIFEHLLAPYNILKSLKCEKIIITVPLKVWFKKAYWNENDDRDKHYHEFEPRQLDFLLEKTAWEIKEKEIWRTPPATAIGIRPLMRFVWPSYYAVYCERKKEV
jgi:hypothetical protein